MQRWCNRHFVRRCWAAIFAVAATAVGAFWLTPTPRYPVYRSELAVIPPANSADVEGRRSLVVQAQFTATPATVARGAQLMARPLRLPRVVVPTTARRLPPVTVTLLASRLPPVSMVTVRSPTEPITSDFHTAPAPIPVDVAPPGSQRDPSDPMCLLPVQTQHDWDDPASPLSVARRQAEQLVRRASALAGRGAIYSARAELESALVTLSQALDSYYATTAFTQCLRSGLLAMEEASDFAPSHARGQLSLDVALITSRHQSHALTMAEASHCAATEAARKYYAFAQDHLAASTGGPPVAAHALFGLGKLYAHLSEPDSAAERQYGPRAMLLHQTALMIDDSHPLAANELGVLLARCGRLNDARQVLRHGVSQHSSPETWRNLADVHERLGEMELANQAHAEWNRIAQLSGRNHSATVAAPNGETVRWVDKATFERGSRDLESMIPHEPLAVQVPKTAAQPQRTTKSRW